MSDPNSDSGSKPTAKDALPTSQNKRDLIELEQAFNRAVGSMTMHFQPIVHAKDHSGFGFEALLRTHDPEIPHPGAMFDAAERLHRVERLGHLIRKDISKRAPETETGLLFVNLHALDLLDPSLTSPFSPLAKICHRVVLEVTERSSVEGIPDIHYRVATLREMGFRIAIDDLGAGHARMKEFSPLETDFVKLDISLVTGIEKNPVKQQLVRSITTLCSDHGISVIGEGVETESEREVLVSLGCDLLQGFLIARPAPEFTQVPLRAP